MEVQAVNPYHPKPNQARDILGIWAIGGSDVQAWNTGGAGSTPTNPLGLMAHMRALGGCRSLPFEVGEGLAGAGGGRRRRWHHRRWRRRPVRMVGISNGGNSMDMAVIRYVGSLKRFGVDEDGKRNAIEAPSSGLPGRQSY